MLWHLSTLFEHHATGETQLIALCLHEGVMFVKVIALYLQGILIAVKVIRDGQLADVDTVEPPAPLLDLLSAFNGSKIVNAAGHRIVVGPYVLVHMSCMKSLLQVQHYSLYLGPCSPPSQSSIHAFSWLPHACNGDPGKLQTTPGLFHLDCTKTLHAQFHACQLLALSHAILL